jgi:type IV pilus assembly protein PilO
LIAAFVFLVYKPKTEQINQSRDEVAKLKMEIARVKIRAKNLKKVEAEEKQVNAQFAEALKLLPNKKEIPTLLRTITQLGKDSNLEFRLFQPKKEKPKTFYYELPVAMQVSGNYHDVATFFDKVGHMKRIVNILNVSMKPVKPNSTNLVTTCDAVTYRFKGKANGKPKKGKKKK